MTETLLPLDSWRANIGFHPWHFWGFAHQTYAPLDSACNGLVTKYPWQATDAAGREDIIEAIANAESTLATQIAMGYYPAPKFCIDTLQFPRYPDKTVDKLGYMGADWRWMAIQLNFARIQNVGVETRTLLGNVLVTYSDEDGDGMDESWTASVATTTTDIEKIAAYFQASDRLDSAPVSEDWRIAPVTVSIAGGVATLRGKAWIMGRPVLYEAPDQSTPLDPTDATNFVTRIDIYLRYSDPTGTTTDTSQVKLIWETLPHPYWCTCYGCSGATTNSTDPAAEAYAMARAVIRNGESGQIGIGEAKYDATNALWASILNWSTCRPPDRLIARYRAGQPLVNGFMDRQMQRIVTRLAAAELNRAICACNEANRELYRWQFDLARTAGAADEAYGATDQEDLNNPLGTRRGHAWAWKQVKYLRNLVGVAVG